MNNTNVESFWLFFLNIRLDIDENYANIHVSAIDWPGKSGLHLNALFVALDNKNSIFNYGNAYAHAT